MVFGTVRCGCLALGRRLRRPDRHHLPPRHRRPHRAGRVQPARGAQRVPPADGRRALPRARRRPAEPAHRRRAAHRQRARARRTAAGRSARAATSASAAATATSTPTAPHSTGRLHILEVQRLIRFMPKVVIAVVPGWAAGGGHSLHVVCDLTIASAEHAQVQADGCRRRLLRRRLRQRLLARQVGQKFAREIFFLAREYERPARLRDGRDQRGRAARRARGDGARLGARRSSASRRPRSGCSSSRSTRSTTVSSGQQVFAGEATRLAYGTDEAVEGRDAFLEKREPDWSPYPWQY